MPLLCVLPVTCALLSCCSLQKAVTTKQACQKLQRIRHMPCILLTACAQVWVQGPKPVSFTVTQVPSCQAATHGGQKQIGSSALNCPFNLEHSE